MQNKIMILGIPFDNITRKEFWEQLYRRMENKEKTFLVTANPEIVMYALENPSYYTLLMEADYIAPDGIHTHGPRANMLINLLSPFLKVKWIVTIHSNPLLDFEGQGLKGKIFEKINTKSLINADGIIAVSSEIKSIAKELGASDNQISTIHNGIKFSNPITGEKDKEMFTLISIGRLHAIKNFDFLIEVLANLDVKNWKLILCGEGEEESRLRRKAKELKCLSNIEFMGWVETDKLGQIISQADVMVHPSRSESFPLVLLEAAEQEVPVIATDVGDVRELFNHSSLGWLIDPDNKKQLLVSLEEAYSDWKTDDLPLKGKKLRERAVYFSLSKQAAHVIDRYNKYVRK